MPKVPPIESLIVTIRQQKVIIDRDLAAIYGTSTRRLNEQVRRNRKRFPPDFVFLLTRSEREELVANCDRFTRLKHATVNPKAFTEHGALMAANVLNSPAAIEMSVFVVRAFVRMREQVGLSQLLGRRLAKIERTLMSHDSSLRDLYEKIRPLLLPAPPSRKTIGFRSR